MYEELSALAAQAVELLRPTVEGPDFPKRASAVSAYMTAFRPYVESAVTGEFPRPLAAAMDRRKKLWRVSMEFWKREGDDDFIIAVSPGRTMSTEGEVTAIGGDVVMGFDGIVELIADYAAGVGAMVPEFQPAAMMRALDDLRSTISRQGGYATMRRISADGVWRLVCDVQREDSE